MTRRFYIALIAVILVLGLGYASALLFAIGRGLCLLLTLLVAVDLFLLYRTRGVSASRQCSDRFSNGDENTVTIHVENRYTLPVSIDIVDELPPQFQRRDFIHHLTSHPSPLTSHPFPPTSPLSFSYTLTPTARGVYSFGHIRAFVRTRLGLVVRRYTCGEPVSVKVYPSFLRLRHYELAAVSPDRTQMGIKRVRHIGHNNDFDHIRDYLQGDDYRTINWRASARRPMPGLTFPRLMVNVYCEERSQQVFSVIDKGRVMQQAFHSMTLLDYAINATLALSYVAMNKEDRAGLITFSNQLDTFVAPERRPGHIKMLMETLYAEQTNFAETDFAALAVGVCKQVSKRSLLLLYTNFFGMVSLQRQLPFLQQIARRHRLVVVFFDDVELNSLAASTANSEEERCQRDMAALFVQEKQQIVTTLLRHGILSLLTTPGQLTPAVINKYLAVRRSA